MLCLATLKVDELLIANLTRCVICVNNKFVIQLPENISYFFLDESRVKRNIIINYRKRYQRMSDEAVRFVQGCKVVQEN